MMSIQKHPLEKAGCVRLPCVNYGTRVQNSVFECVLDNAQFLLLKSKLCSMIDEEVDSLRFYHLGNSHKAKVEHVGLCKGINVEEPLLF